MAKFEFTIQPITVSIPPQEGVQQRIDLQLSPGFLPQNELVAHIISAARGHGLTGDFPINGTHSMRSEGRAHKYEISDAAGVGVVAGVGAILSTSTVG